ncbi:hypothetical protein Aduo_006072 [Ancylostoma duodenale]
MLLRLFALVFLIDGYYPMSVDSKFLQQFPLESFSLHDFQQHLLKSSAHKSTGLAAIPASEEDVAKFLLDYERTAAKVHNKAIINVSMKPIASFIQVTFEVHLQSGTPFVTINNKKLCVGTCWADLLRLGDSISVNFTGDPSNVIYVNWRSPTQFTFTYDFCEQPLDNVQCRNRKNESSTVCICNEGVESCDFSSPPLLNKEEWLVVFYLFFLKFSGETFVDPNLQRQPRPDHNVVNADNSKDDITPNDDTPSDDTQGDNAPNDANSNKR